MRTVFFDLETAGLEADSPDIQIAAIAVDADYNELATFERKIEFDLNRADAQALDMNSFDADVWARDAVPELLVVPAFAAFLEEHRSLEMVSKRTGNPYRVAQLAGHNVAKFDAPRLLRMFERNAKRFLAADVFRPLDTMQLALWYFRTQAKPASFQLGDLCDALGIEKVGAHDALADVRMTIAVARELELRMQVERAA